MITVVQSATLPAACMLPAHHWRMPILMANPVMVLMLLCSGNSVCLAALSPLQAAYIVETTSMDHAGFMFCAHLCLHGAGAACVLDLRPDFID